MEIIKNNILKSRDIKNVSANVYSQNLNRLHRSLYNEDLVNINFLYNFDEVIENLKLFKLSIQKNIISAIIVVLSCYNTHTELHSKYFIILEKVIREYKNKKKEDLPTIRDLEKCLRKLKKILNNNNYLDEDVLEITDFDRQILNRYLIGCLFIYFPPRLPQDYRDMKVIRYEDFNENKENISYLVIVNKKQKFFSFYKKNKRTDIKINPKFNEILNLYLKFHKHKIFIPYKFKVNNEAIKKYIKDCFLKYNVNFTKLRKIYIKEYVYGKDDNEAELIVKQMGYSKSVVNLIINNYHNNI